LENEVEKRTLELEEKTFQLEKSNLELKNLNNHLETISYIDELTKIPNRRMLFDEIKILIELALKNHQRVALLMIDIDYFKLYNDFYGHSKGDWCIFNIAQSIDSAAVEYGYFCARYGGEEFVVVGIEKHENEMASLAETIMDYVAELEIENENAPKGRYVTVSIGGCSYKVNGKIGIRTFIDFADDMLYDAKKSGRDIFKFKKI
jgi:diguanylate cyclase (GGDEF)-like protein